MPTMDFFPQRPPVSPKIYAYELIGVASHRGYIKVGYTERDVDTRIRSRPTPWLCPTGCWKHGLPCAAMAVALRIKTSTLCCAAKGFGN